MNLKEICRLCAKNSNDYKDLSETDNEEISELISRYIGLSVIDNNNLSTKICIVCTEKLLSFHLFMLECIKVQESFRRCLFEESNVDYKSELPFILNVSIENDLKQEVKDEPLLDDIRALSDDGSLSDGECHGDLDLLPDSCVEVKAPSDSSEDFPVQEYSKRKLPRQKRKDFVKSEHLTQILTRKNLRVKDFVKLLCNHCEKEWSSWDALKSHVGRSHKSRPLVQCVCGLQIQSKTVLYKHISDHKLESRNSSQDESPQNLGIYVKDFYKFECSICQKDLLSWYRLKAHTLSKHKMKPVVTCKCGMVVKSKSVLYKHVADHRDTTLFVCDQCPRITKSKRALENHKMRHIPKSDRIYRCEECPKICKTKESMRSHQRVHIPKENRKIYPCGVCEMKFTTQSAARGHKRAVHEKIKRFVCDLCGYACSTGGELRQHRAIHSDDKPHKCPTCGKAFKTYSNLSTHIDTHLETSYVCDICKRRLNSRRTLRKHRLVHDDVCRHVCSFCNKAFKRRQTLKVHLHTHTGDKPISCKWCDEKFSYSSTLRSHKLRCHADKLSETMSNKIDYVPSHKAVEVALADDKLVYSYKV